MGRFMGRWAALGVGLALAGGAAAASAEELKVGDKAPPFSLQGTDGKTYSLDQFKGKKAVVLAWFPKADTPGCTRECKSFKENGTALRGLNVAYFTASVDTPEDNKKFSDKFGFDFPILSDPDKSVARAYGVLSPKGFAQRWTFYIDKDGTIKEIDKAVQKNTEGAGQVVVEKLKSLGIASQ